MTNSPLISILIPVYNRDVADLVSVLHQQCTSLAEDYQLEIIVVDDGSTEKFANKDVCRQLSLILYNELPENRGRAEVRNNLLNIAGGRYVLFLDCDMLPDNDDFIADYCRCAVEGADVVCGGISYKQVSDPEDHYSFYLYKSCSTEALSARQRSANPWRYLFTSNVMIQREIMNKIPYDLRFTGYGFEDVEWGIRAAASCEILHIDNSCSHMGVKNKKAVFARMRESIGNYHLLLTLHPDIVAKSGAAGLAGYLCHIPSPLLACADKILSFAFAICQWNKISLNFFQLDKAVLLAKIIREQKGRA